MKSLGQRLLELALLALFLGLALFVVRLTLNRPWDTETYWYAASAAISGLNPYDLTDLSQLAHRAVGMPFLYPPATVLLFVPLTVLPVLQAAELWALAKVALLFGLFRIWRSGFLKDVSPILLLAVVVFGYNAAAVWDLKTGNIATLEALLLWAGFAAYARGRRGEFAAWVVAASLFKLLPIAFLLLLLAPSRNGRRDGRTALCALAVWAVVVFLPLLVGPAWARGYLHQLPAERPWGTACPSALGLIDMLLGEQTAPLSAPSWRAISIWAAYALALIAFSIPAVRRLGRRGGDGERVMAAVVLFALLTPRMMAYSYLLVVAPSLALGASIPRRLGGVFAVGGVLMAQALLAPVLRFDYRNPWLANAPFLLLLGLWLGFLSNESRRHLSAPPRAVLRPA
ncbi:MAG TPA: glycosyltransferase family 87 protein [Candidatus Binatia bacterium]|nr:glycosyltransferase family 87 protein [Candidatus Binatia bacterium]